MTRKLGQVQRKQIKVDPDVHEEKAREDREIMLDLAQLTLHFEIQILELGSLRQYEKSMSPQRNLAVDKGSIGLDRSKVCENELANYGRRVARNEHF